MTKPRPPAGWQAVGVVVLVLACQGTAAGKVSSTPVPIRSWAPVASVPTQVPPTAAPTPKATPRPTPRPTRAPGASYAAGSVAAAKAYALGALGQVQYACLDAIVTRESHWNPTDRNRTSGAYGLGQALPGSKMASAGSDWRTNPVTQVRWMLSYVRARYGSACLAWRFWLDHFWY